MSEMDLLNILNDLKDNEFEELRWCLKYETVGHIPPIKESQLSKVKRHDVVDLLVRNYGFAGAVEIIKTILKKIRRNDLVTRLSTIISGGKDQEKVLQRKFPGVVEDEFSREMCARCPKVQIQGGVNFIICEGPIKEVQLAETKLEDPIKKIEHLKNLHLQYADEVQKNISDKNRLAEGAGGKLLYHRITQDSVMKSSINSNFAGQNERKISIVLLGTAAHLKKSLMSLITGKDVFAHRSTDVKIETYSNDTYEVTFTPNLYKASENIRRLFSSQQHPDMCLLVVEDEFSPQEVWHQIEHLYKITGKPTEDFIVVLPLGCEPEKYHPFKFYSLEDLFNKLRKLTEDRNHKPTNKRSADQSHSRMEMENHSVTKVNLVLLGMFGSGKSASGNTILGKRRFESKPSSVPITRECQAAETVINGTYVRVIDTPDMFDDEIYPSVKNQHVKKCKQLCQSDPCVYLLVMEVGRFKDGERDILRKVEEAFGRRAKEQIILLFTHGENLQRDKISFEEFLRSCQPELKKIIEQCDRRCVVFENKASRQHQVIELMQTVNRMLNI